MRESVRFCATPAGRVAYSIMGDGPLLVCDTGWVSHLNRWLEMRSARELVGALAEHFSLVRFDKAGTGLSDHTGVDLSFQGQVDTIIAIADHLGAESFDLLGASQGGQVAAAVAAREPERTRGLVIYGTCARGEDLAPTGVRASLVALVRAHWGLGSHALAGIFIPDQSPDDVREFCEFQRNSATAEVAAEILSEYYRTDITSILPTIQAPTLVLHRDGDRAASFRLGREVASLIPGATFVALHGRTHLFWMGEWRAVVGATVDFLRSLGDASQADSEVRLSPRETEVAALVAEGLTNEDIARRLFIAPRTAETHLENIRHKLGFRSRAQVAAWVASRRLPAP